MNSQITILIKPSGAKYTISEDEFSKRSPLIAAAVAGRQRGLLSGDITSFARAAFRLPTIQLDGTSVDVWEAYSDIVQEGGRDGFEQVLAKLDRPRAKYCMLAGLIALCANLQDHTGLADGTKCALSMQHDEDGEQGASPAQWELTGCLLQQQYAGPATSMEMQKVASLIRELLIQHHVVELKAERERSAMNIAIEVEARKNAVRAEAATKTAYQELQEAIDHIEVVDELLSRSESNQNFIAEIERLKNQCDSLRQDLARAHEKHATELQDAQSRYSERVAALKHSIAEELGLRQEALKAQAAHDTRLLDLTENIDRRWSPGIPFIASPASTAAPTDDPPSPSTQLVSATLPKASSEVEGAHRKRKVGEETMQEATEGPPKRVRFAVEDDGRAE